MCSNLSRLLRGTLDSGELSAKPAAAEVFKMSRRMRRPENSRFAWAGARKTFLVLSCRVIVGHLLYRNEKLPAGELWLSIAEPSQNAKLFGFAVPSCWALRSLPLPYCTEWSLKLNESRYVNAVATAPVLYRVAAMLGGRDHSRTLY